MPRDDEVGESFWAAKIRTALAGSLSTTSVGAWFGGMGSLNDEDQPRERA